MLEWIYWSGVLKDKLKLLEVCYQNGSITMLATQDLLYLDKEAPEWLQECQQKLYEVSILMSSHQRYFGRQLEGKPVTITDGE